MESKLEGSRKEQRCIEEQLVQSQEEVSSIKLKFGKCIGMKQHGNSFSIIVLQRYFSMLFLTGFLDSIQLLSKYLDRISLEDVDFVDTKISIEDEMVAVLGKKLLKQYEIMREIISINSVVDEHANDAGESVDGSGLMGDSALKKLHHLDLIRDSYEKVNSFSLTSSVGSMKNGIALQTKLYTCLKEKQFIEELLISTLRELKFIRSLTDCKLDDSLCNADRSDEIYKCLQNVEMEQLSDELKVR